RHDPLTQGPRLFQSNCGSCHEHQVLTGATTDRKPAASDLTGFGSEVWIFRLLTRPSHPDFFGRTKLSTMNEWIQSNMNNVGLDPEEAAKLSAEDKAAYEKDRADLRAIAHWLSLHPRSTSKERGSPAFEQGLTAFRERDCKQCHAYEGVGGKRGPDVTGY